MAFSIQFCKWKAPVSGRERGRTAGDVPVSGTLPSFWPIFAGVVPVFGTSPAPSPNSRTEMPVLRAERVIAVRHRPISALGARGWAFLLPIGGADVRLFGGKGEIPPAPGGQPCFHRIVDHKNVENRCLGCRCAQCTDRMHLRLDYVYTPSDNPLLMSVFGEQCTRKCPGEPLSMYTACE